MHHIAVVDMQPSVRMAFRSQVAGSEEFQIVGDAADLAAGMIMIRESRPDLVVVDLDLPGEEGLELIQKVRALGQDIRLLARAAHTDPLQVACAIVAGAHGFLEKSADAKPAMRAVGSGYFFFPEIGIDQTLLSSAHRMLRFSKKTVSRKKRSQLS